MATGQEILARPREDRSLLPNVPEPPGNLIAVDRRGFPMGEEMPAELHPNAVQEWKDSGQRYEADFPVRARFSTDDHQDRFMNARCVEISNTGMLMRIPRDQGRDLAKLTKGKFRFSVPGGVMPEGCESRVNIGAEVARTFRKRGEGGEDFYVAIRFERPLKKHHDRHRWRFAVPAAGFLLMLVVSLVVLMRTESFVYFRFHQFLYLYSIIAATFLLSRYLFGSLYRNVPLNPRYEPGVSIIIPVFNEEQWISRTIASCLDQSYPAGKLELIIVDDCSTDGTAAEIRKTLREIHRYGERFGTRNRVTFMSLKKNSGKREALIRGVRHAKHDLVVFVDSDSFLEPNAIRNLVQPFQDPDMGGVAGRTEVANKFTNYLSKLQTVRYYIAFRIMKAAEAYFDAVTCLSGPLSCYRKDLVLQYADAWLNQRFLGHPATFGDDRSMTNYILKTHRTGYQDSAVCSTIVPSTGKMFLRQQMRWKRSWLRESLRALTFMWKKEPLMFLFFLVGLIVPIAAPIVVLYNFVYIPIFHGFFPSTFIVGLALMAMLMSFAYLFFRKSRLWAYGFVFVLYYTFILLWQMPVAWVTFYKSTWGTRDTPQDVAAGKKRGKRWPRNGKAGDGDE
ncbi:hyaluronan synthase [Bhargavaea cecembensis]|uniref:Hyaluronan synthase n=1 Tax=Bhargavaea cecembensis TaxID=394098 RepID=A0A163FHQ2_9BACL|nr:glycosyltransferase family 2 protein [Bhargavaea cecembensis]KZE38717.1 hyaluronan synthase [Bhargavaea cecembensis]